MWIKWVGLAPLLLTAVTGQQITVYSGGNLAVGQSKQLTAYVPLPVNTVNWSVNGMPGGSVTYGSISTNGLYIAPASIPMQNAVTVQATSTADAAKFGTVTITITQPPVQLWSTSPSSVPAGQFSIVLNGANFGQNSVVNFGRKPLATVLVSSTSVQATGTATLAQVGSKVPITVTNSGLGGTTSGSVNLGVTAAVPVTVAVSPATATVSAGATQQFKATVSGSANTAVTWTASAGSVSSTGLYTAPAAAPPVPTVTITATSAAATSSQATATVTVQPPLPPAVTVAVMPANVTVGPSATQQFTAAVANTTNTGVTWTTSAGTISATGLYTAPATAPTPATVTVTATSNASKSASGIAMLSIVGPPNPGTGLGTPNLSAGRFLEQATFGPMPGDIAHFKQLGIPAWLTEQFDMPETAIVDPGSQSSSSVTAQYISRLSLASDQLRQRVAYALGQIFVISMNKNNYPDEIVPYLQILSRNSFGNYRTLLSEMSMSSQMGKYLDLAGSTKPGVAGGANENYARESMQLFSIGVNMLNLDGSLKLDAQGKPISTYDQPTVHQVALALTGWVYKNNAWEDFSGPLQPNEVNHDTTQKTFLGCTLAANQSTTQDMNGFLDCLFNHPNVAPFVSTRLIRSMVTSNPSPGYIQRVATVFNNNGSGVRGDLRAVVTAILTDPEARNDSAPATSGRLKDSIFHIVSLVRQLNGSITPNNGLPWLFGQMGQSPLTAPSVFSFYSPLYHLPKSQLFAPEFQIYTPTESVLRANFFWWIISNNPVSDFTLDFSSFVAVAGNTPQLIDAVDQALLYGRMPQRMRQSLATAITAQQDNPSKAQLALYLTALSGLYAIQY